MIIMERFDRFYHKKYRSQHQYHKTVFIIDAILITIILILSGIVVRLAFVSPSLASGLKVSLSAPASVRVADGFALQAQLTNTNKIPLTEARWELLPAVGARPLSPIYGSLGTLMPQTQNKFEIKLAQYGVAVFEPITRATYRVRITFKNSETNESEEVIASTETALTENPYSIKITAPDQAVFGQEIPYTVSITNNIKKPMDDLDELIVEANNELVYIDFDAKNRSGKLHAGRTGKMPLVARALIELDGVRYPVAVANKNINIVSSPLKINFSEKILPLKIGTTENRIASVENISDQTVFLQALTYARLATPLEIAPHTSVNIPLNFSVPNSFKRSQLDGQGGYSIYLEATATFSEFQKVSWLVNKISFPIETPLLISAQARFMNEFGDQLGSGPWPPRVGKETRVWIFTNFAPQLHTVKNFSATFALPAFAQATGKKTINGNASLNTAANSVVLSSPTISPDEPLTVGFEISLTPDSQSAAGENTLLVSSIAARATDDTTDSSIRSLFGPIHSQGAL